jgi:thioredoxin 1
MADTFVEEVDGATLDESLAGSDGVVLLEIWGEGCPPCRAIAPVLEELAGQVEGLTVLKANIDEHPGLAARFDVLGVPTLLFFVEGRLAQRLVGARSKPALVEEIHRLVRSPPPRREGSPP